MPIQTTFRDALPAGLTQSSNEGETWQQSRIAHLHTPCARLAAGIYACSPLDGRFTCAFTRLTIADNRWGPAS